MKVMPFGKHRGRSLEWIADNDILYLDWAVDIVTHPDLKKAIADILDERQAEVAEAMAAREAHREWMEDQIDWNGSFDRE